MNKKVKSIIAALAITGTILTMGSNTAKAAEITCNNTTIDQSWIQSILNKYPEFKNLTITTTTKTVSSKPAANTTKTNKPTTTTNTTPAKPAATNTNSSNSNTTAKPAENSGQTSNINSEATEVIRLVNIERSKNGLAPLKANGELSKVATVKAQDMIDKNYFDHTSPTYGSPFDMMKKFGINYTAAGENIAYGQKTPAEVMNAWMNSPGHRANILNSNFTEIGVGVAKDKNGTPYWVQMFINPGK